MKKITILLMMTVLSFYATGCFKRDNLEDIDIYATAYPIEYIVERLYGAHSTVYSIYPDGVNINDYTLTDKQILDYSKASLFVFNGLSSEKDYVIPMFNHNKNLRIIDTSLTMEYSYGIEELWLDPSNFLMLAQNVRDGLEEYINNHYLKNDIEEQYEQLKIEVSNLDAKIKLMMDSSDNKTLIVSNDVFKFLEKYGFTVISLEENEDLTEKKIADVTALIDSGENSYIFTLQNEEINDTIKEIQEKTDVELITLHSLSNLTDEERNDNQNYLSLMNNNIELLKNELYD